MTLYGPWLGLPHAGGPAITPAWRPGLPRQLPVLAFPSFGAGGPEAGLLTQGGRPALWPRDSILLQPTNIVIEFAWDLMEVTHLWPPWCLVSDRELSTQARGRARGADVDQHVQRAGHGPGRGPRGQQEQQPPRGVAVALGVQVVLTPHCILPQRFSIRNILRAASE